jgi:hypothetical protein
MNTRRVILAGLAAMVVAPSGPARADVKPFDAKAFAAAQDAGKGIVVHVHAPW